VIIDVGINRITKEKANPQLLEWRKEDFETKGATLIGDVDFLKVEPKVSYIYSCSRRSGTDDNCHAAG